MIDVTEQYKRADEQRAFREQLADSEAAQARHVEEADRARLARDETGKELQRLNAALAKKDEEDARAECQNEQVARAGGRRGPVVRSLWTTRTTYSTPT